MNVLAELMQVIQSRKQDDPATSYVASLYDKGLNTILQKVGEEATETIIAAKELDNRANAENKKALTNEVADLWFHSMVMLAHLDLSADDVLKVLALRFGVSGHDEKAGRSSS